MAAVFFVLVLGGCDAEPPVAGQQSVSREDPAIGAGASETGEGQALAEAAIDPEDEAEDEAGPSQLAQFGGAAAAVAELCGRPYEPAALVTMKDKQKQLYVATGGDPSRYEADFQAGQARGRAEFKAAGSDQRHQFCGTLSDGG